MDTKSMTIDFHHFKKKALQVILTDQYIKRYGNGMTYTIGGNQEVNEILQNLMG